MGPALVGSACPAAWLIVTVGATLSNATELSVLVEAPLVFPAASAAAPAGTVAATAPGVVIPDTATVYVVPAPRTPAARGPPLVLPARLTSEAVNPVTGSLKRTANTGEEFVGPVPPARLIVTVGGSTS